MKTAWKRLCQVFTVRLWGRGAPRLRANKDYSEIEPAFEYKPSHVKRAFSDTEPLFIDTETLKPKCSSSLWSLSARYQQDNHQTGSLHAGTFKGGLYGRLLPNYPCTSLRLGDPPGNYLCGGVLGTLAPFGFGAHLGFRAWDLQHARPLTSLSFPSESLTRSYELLSILALLRDLSSGHRGP